MKSDKEYGARKRDSRKIVVKLICVCDYIQAENTYRYSLAQVRVGKVYVGMYYNRKKKE